VINTFVNSIEYEQVAVQHGNTADLVINPFQPAQDNYKEWLENFSADFDFCWCVVQHDSVTSVPSWHYLQVCTDTSYTCRGVETRGVVIISGGVINPL